MIKIVTDSSSEISPQLASELGITVVPLRIQFGTRIYHDGIDIERTTFHQQLSRSPAAPKVEPPLIEEIQQVYSQLFKTTDQILSIHGSAKLTRTVQVAQEAAKSFWGRNKITVIDSRMISWGLELIVTLAADATQRTNSMSEIVRLVRGMVPHIYMVFFAENPEYLERYGFSGRGRALSDSLSGVRPLVILEEGEIMPMERGRTRGKSVDRLFEFVAEFARFDRAVVLQGRLSEDSRVLFERLGEAFPEKKIDIRPYGTVLATYLGPDALGVAVYEGV